MRFIVMHKVDEKMEAGEPPEKTIIQEMGGLISESLRNGQFLDGAGLHRSARRARVRAHGGKWTVEKGPYAGGNELVASVAMIRTASIDEAVEVAGRYAAALGDAEIEVGPVVEGWDLTGAPKPANVVGERFLLLLKGDAAYERGAARADAEAVLRRVVGERPPAELLVFHRVAPSSTGARLPLASGGKRTWTDGPFAETKELIAGFSILELPSRADAIAWATRYAEILGRNEVDVRRMEDRAAG